MTENGHSKSDVVKVMHKRFRLITLFASVLIFSFVISSHGEGDGSGGASPGLFFGMGGGKDRDKAALLNALSGVQKSLLEEIRNVANQDPERLASLKVQLGNVERSITSLISRRDTKSRAQNFVTALFTETPFDQIYSIDFNALTYHKDLPAAVGKGILLQSAQSLGKQVVEEVNKTAGTVVKPLFHQLNHMVTRAYQIFFRGGMVPFSVQETGYWRDIVVTSLQLLMESARDIAEITDRDRQQRTRDLIRNFTVDTVANEGEKTESIDLQKTVLPANFASMITKTSVIPSIEKVVNYIIERCRYYTNSPSPASIEAQIIDQATIIMQGLHSLVEEIERYDSLQQLASPEFRAVIPHYITYLSKSFENLSRLLSPITTPVEQTAKGPTSTHNNYTNSLPSWGRREHNSYLTESYRSSLL